MRTYAELKGLDRKAMERIYEVNGLRNYKFRNIEELKLIGIDVTKAKGYSKLDTEHKDLYERFAVDYINANGLMHRLYDFTNVFICKHLEFIEVKEDGDRYFKGSQVWDNTDINSMVLVKENMEDVTDYETYDIEDYFRVELYNHRHDHAEWFHVQINPKYNNVEWY